MEAASLALSAVQTLLTALQCQDLRNVLSFFDYESQLTELQNTVSTVTAVLLDAETKQELSNEARDYVEKLKDAIYDADDLLDEFVTIAEQKQLLKDGKPSEKVRHFFSRFNPVLVATDMKKRVNQIQNKLKAIANDHNNFRLGVDCQRISRRKEETCSYVYESIIFGRKDDVDKIVNILEDGNQNQPDVSILSIVGIGGLGKTALAQLLFNDKRVTSAFPKRLWICVSDHEQEDLDVEGILCKILTSATGVKQDELPKEEVQKQLRTELASNKYLLVLDDVWTENRKHWLKLAEYLWGSQRGSWIVVTTRSEETGTIIGSNAVYKLQGLSKDDSWSLFKKVAFGSEQPNPDDDLVIYFILAQKLQNTLSPARPVFVYIDSVGCSSDKMDRHDLEALLKKLKSARAFIVPELLFQRLFAKSYRNLPNWIRCLTSLETLRTECCEKLESLPRWMSELTSLKKLYIDKCSDEIAERCQKPAGENWPYIQHITQININLHCVRCCLGRNSS